MAVEAGTVQRGPVWGVGGGLGEAVSGYGHHGDADGCWDGCMSEIVRSNSPIAYGIFKYFGFIITPTIFANTSYWHTYVVVELEPETSPIYRFCCLFMVIHTIYFT